MNRVKLKPSKSRKIARQPNQHSWKPGPHSKAWLLAKINFRSNERLLTNRTSDELIAYVGGHPSATQRMIIERCPWIQLRLSLLDKKLAEGRDFTEIDTHTYLAWANSLARLLAKLGMREVPSAASEPTL